MLWSLIWFYWMFYDHFSARSLLCVVVLHMPAGKLSVYKVQRERSSRGSNMLKQCLSRLWHLLPYIYYHNVFKYSKTALKKIILHSKISVSWVGGVGVRKVWRIIIMTSHIILYIFFFHPPPDVSLENGCGNIQTWNSDHIHTITRIGVFAQGQILCISPNGL